jgi:hypothetical protein
VQLGVRRRRIRILGTLHHRRAELLTIAIFIASDYTCAGIGCWYRFEYEYTGSVNDTTTWAAHVVGNPIRIVE